MIIRTIEDLAAYLKTTVDRLEHDVYTYTDCGAWITWTDESITIGSIVEGSDAEFSYTLAFPFADTDYDYSMGCLEQLVDEAWHEANDD